MQTIKPYIDNLRQAGALVIILAGITGYIANSFWYYIPIVSKTYFGETQVPSMLSMPFIVFGWYLANSILNTIGLALFINKKGALNGFIIGLFVSTFFSLTAYLASYLGTGTPLPPLSVSLIVIVGNLLFYAIPATLIGHLRKD